SETTRTAVEAAVAELGYVPNTAARALAANRTDAIALVVPGDFTEEAGRLPSRYAESAAA
ncbi:hypothetical protein ACFCZV_38340, partial [Streptomyces hydrogenans]